MIVYMIAFPVDPIPAFIRVRYVISPVPVQESGVISSG